MMTALMENLSFETLPVISAAVFLAGGLASLAIWFIKSGQPINTPGGHRDRINQQIDLLQTERQKIFTAKDDGSITANEFELACLEIDRRLLALSRQSDSQNVPDNVSRPLAWMIGIILPAVTLAIYLAIGSPQSPDRPYASRSTEIAAAKSRAAANETAGASALRAAINASERAPRDVEKWLQLAQAAANVGDVETEIRALRTALGLTNQDPSIMSMLAESLSRAADGQVTVPARELIKTVLAANPDEPRALFLAGLAHFQDGAYADAISSWQRLLTISQPNAPWVTLVRENIARAAEAGDIKLADQGPGPDAAAIADAASMTEDERKAMINDMVNRLEQRLTKEPGDIDGWLRLARAYDVMEQPDKALTALDKAARLAPENLDLQFGVMELVLRSGKTKEELVRSRLALKNAEAIAPEHPQTLFFKGHIARTGGDIDTARAAWQALLTKLPADSEMASGLAAEIDKLN